MDLASVATLVVCERDVSAAYPSGMASTGGRTLCVSVRHLVAGGPTVCWDTPDGDAVVVGDDAVADLDGRGGFDHEG